MKRLINQDVWSSPELEEQRLLSIKEELNWEDDFDNPIDPITVILQALSWWKKDEDYARESGNSSAEWIAIHKSMAISDLLAVINNGRSQGSIK